MNIFRIDDSFLLVNKFHPQEFINHEKLHLNWNFTIISIVRHRDYKKWLKYF